MPPVPKHTRASRANGAKTQAGHEAAKSMEQLTATHAALTAAHAAVTADLLSSQQLYSQLREQHCSLLVVTGQREQQWELDLLGWVQQLEQLEEAFLQELQGSQAQLTDTAAALEAAQKGLAAARTELAHTKQQLTTTNSKLEQLRAQVAAANKGLSKDHKDKWNLLMRSRVSLPFLRGMLSSQGTKPATQPACHPATQSTCLARPRNQERDTHTGGYTAEYILSHERLLCLPGVSAEQLGTLCTAVVGAVFPGADPGRQASATTHRRNHDLLQTYIHEAHTAAASAPNPLTLEGPQQWAAAKPKLVVLINKHIQALYEYLYEHSQLFFQLPHLLAAMGSSSALYAQKAAEQVLKQRDTRLQEWDVHQRQKQQQQQGGRRQAPSGQQFLPFDPAVFDPYATLEDFLDDIRELAAGQPCSLGLRTHLVEFFGAAPSSNHAVESSLQHTKHGNSAKQGLDAMIGSINNKLDPGALANIDLADFEARLLTLRKQKRDKETRSADDNREAKAARKTEESACMVDGNAKMVLNVPTQVPLQQLQQAFQQHARGADYSNTSAKEATRFTREQLRAYLRYHKVPPRDQPVGSTLVAGWQKAVQKHIAERGSPTGHGVLP
ncbi:hypothetical protein QJQ45_016657 [Haematococcus lacustris]|nr:hypothetical protein QJQ45_016657 [Haematococcus lacustris]